MSKKRLSHKTILINLIKTYYSLPPENLYRTTFNVYLKKFSNLNIEEFLDNEYPGTYIKEEKEKEEK